MLARGRLLALALLGASAWPATARAQSASELQVTPETMTLGVGQKQRIFAAAYDRQGNLLQSAKFSFWSSDTLIARVGTDGTVVGVSPGLAKVEARVPGRRASLAVLITGSERADDSGHGTAPPGSVLALDPGSLVLLPGESASITPQGLKDDGSPATIGRVSWKSLRPEIVLVDSSGAVTALAVGKSIIQASTSNGLMATAPVEVAAADVALSSSRLTLAPDEAESLRVVVPSQSGRSIRGAVRWSSSDSGIAAVDSSGVVTAHRPGQAEIVAAGFGQERRVPVLVYRLPQSLVVSPRQTTSPILLPIQSTRKFTAIAEAADSSPIPEARIVWEVGDTSILARDSTRSSIVAKALGTTTLTARLRGFEPVIWNIQVVPGILELDRPRVGIVAGDHAVLAARLLDEQHKPLGPTGPLAWTSDRPAVATVTGSGDVAAVRPGHAAISVSAPWGGTDTADVFVMSDLLLASTRSGSPGIYQARSSTPDSLVPLLVDSASNIQPVPSPDRTRVAFSSNRAGSFDLWVMDADGRNAHRLTTDPGTEGEPAWTPDGSRIIYTASPKTGLPQIASIRVDGTDNRALTAAPGGNRLPDVSPDGAAIAFVSTRDGNPKLYVMSIDGTGQHRLTKGSDRESTPRYLPNGDLVYTTERGGGSRVYRLTRSATGGVMVLETARPVLSLDVSRDGSRIVYTAGKLADGGKGKTRIDLVLQPFAAGTTPALVPLRPGEQVLSVSF